MMNDLQNKLMEAFREGAPILLNGEKCRVVRVIVDYASEFNQKTSTFEMEINDGEGRLTLEINETEHGQGKRFVEADEEEDQRSQGGHGEGGEPDWGWDA